MIHLLVALAYSKSTNGITIQVHLSDTFGMLNTDILINRPLIDTKKQLVLIDGIFQTIQPCHLCLASGKPARGTIDRVGHILTVCLTAWALIKCHGDGRSQIGLDLHTFFRSHKDLMPVNM